MTVTVYIPGFVVSTVGKTSSTPNVEPEMMLMDVALNTGTGPVGETSALTVNCPANPPILSIVRVEVALEPALIEEDVGLATSVKSGTITWTVI